MLSYLRQPRPMKEGDLRRAPFRSIHGISVPSHARPSVPWVDREICSNWRDFSAVPVCRGLTAALTWLFAGAVPRRGGEFAGAGVQEVSAYA